MLSFPEKSRRFCTQFLLSLWSFQWNLCFLLFICVFQKIVFMNKKKKIDLPFSNWGGYRYFIFYLVLHSHFIYIHSHLLCKLNSFFFKFSSFLFFRGRKKERKQKYYWKKDKQNTVVFVVYILHTYSVNDQQQQKQLSICLQYVYNLFRSLSATHKTFLFFSSVFFDEWKIRLSVSTFASLSANPNDQ